MKKLLLLFSGSMLMSAKSEATIFNVNNNANSPGQYTTISAAINAAQPGDTIMVAGSNTTYDILVLSKRLVILGAGYAPKKDVPFSTKIQSMQVTGSGANNSVIQGFWLSSGNVSCSNVNGLEISRCYFSSGIISCTLTNCSNVNFFQNVSEGGGLSLGNCNSVLVTNNIFTSYISGSPNSNIIIKNNLFLGQNGTYGTIGAIVSNNIAYYRATSPNPSQVFQGNNSVFTKNIYYNQSATPIQLGTNGNTGTGNLQANPLLNLITLTGSFGTVVSTDDYRLQLGSPAIAFGTDGFDAGPYGGFVAIDYPLAGESLIPQVKSMTINNNVVLPGSSLNINVKAKKAN